ncbi:MAG: MaoC family dehydratase N-terminal domain-containing protein [Acidobacteriota bacterium]
MTYDPWIGKTETISGVVTPWPVTALSATLDRHDTPDPLPPLWHWLYLLPTARHSELGSDGHPQRGGFLPPIDLPRRMWAGGRFEFHDALRIGDPIARTSRIVDIQEKQGRTGKLVFVVVRHEVHTPRGFALSEEQDIVYRELAGETPVPPQAPADAAWERTIHPDDVLLFRYSALTFNGHRIHYDRRYCLEQEGYPGLVVHGPLIATLLLDLVRRNLPDRNIRKFQFRAVSPLFDTAPFTVCGKPEGASITLWARNSLGQLSMTASAELSSS